VLKYIGLAIFALNFACWKVFKGTRWIDPASVDLHSGRQEFFQVESVEDARWKGSFWAGVVARLKRRL
jgi:amino acid transporter